MEGRRNHTGTAGKDENPHQLRHAFTVLDGEGDQPGEPNGNRQSQPRDETLTPKAIATLGNSLCADAHIEKEDRNGPQGWRTRSRNRVSTTKPSIQQKPNDQEDNERIDHTNSRETGFHDRRVESVEREARDGTEQSKWAQCK